MMISPAGKKVLLIENDPATCAICRLMLSVPEPVANAESGLCCCVYGTWILQCASTVRDAVRALSQERYDVVLLDLTLPDASGLEALRAIRTVAPEVAIVVQGGTEDSDLVRRLLLDEHVADYLVKGDVRGAKAFKQRMCNAIIRFQIQREAMLTNTMALINGGGPIPGMA